jgi:hypothetical protein
MGRRLRAGGPGVVTEASHPRWPQIFSAGPNGVNPLRARSRPMVTSTNTGGDELIGEAGSEFRVDIARSRQVGPGSRGWRRVILFAL